MLVRPTFTSAEFARLVELESERVEFKTGVGNEPLQDAFVALSNTNGGVVFVGIDDRRRVVGRALDQATEHKINQAALDARDIGRYEIHEIRIDGTRVIAIEVRQKHEGFAQTSSGRVLVRRGSRNVALFGGELLRFLQQRALRRFELTDTGLAVSAADPELLKELCHAFGWHGDDLDLEDRLRERGLVTVDRTLTVAGALFVTDPLTSLRQNKAIIEVRRHPTEGSDYDLRLEFGGPLHHQVRDCTTFLMQQLGSDLVVTGLYRHELPRLPEVVVREAIANAVAHRSYEHHRAATVVELRPDRVAITSPGGLPEPVTVATMRQAQAARNQDVIAILRRFRLAEDAGRGIDVMEDKMREALLDPPRFSEIGDGVRVELPLRGPITPRERAWVADLERRGEIAPADRLLLVHAARGERLTNGTARTILGVGHVEARQALQRLRDAGLLEQRGERGGASYVLVEHVAPPAGFRMSPGEVADLVVAAAAEQPLSNERVRELTGLGRSEALMLLRRLVAERRLDVTGSRRGTRYVAR